MKLGGTDWGGQPVLRDWLAPLFELWCQQPPTSALAPEILGPLASLVPHLADTPPRVVCFGSFKAGKSTLLNALVGKNILPARANRATGVVTRLTWGVLGARVVLRTPIGIETRTINPEAVASFVLLDLQGGQSIPPEMVEAVYVSMPAPVLHGIELVDTPGLQDTDDLNNQTRAEIETADLAIMVLSAPAITSGAEQTVATEINHMLDGNLIFVVNRLDQIDHEDRDEVLDWAAGVIGNCGNDMVGQPRIFATEAHLSLQMRSANHGIDDGVAAVERWIVELFRSPTSVEIVAVSRLRRVERACEAVLRQARQQLAAAAHERNARTSRTAEFERRQTEQRRRLARAMAELSSAIPLLVAEATSAAQSEFERLFETEHGWHSRAAVESVFTRQASAVGEALARRVAAALPAAAPPEPITLQTIPLDLPEPSSRMMWAATAAGLAVGTVVFPWIGTAVGGVIGNRLGKLSQEGVRQRARSIIDAALEASSEGLRQQGEAYLGRLRRRLDARLLAATSHIGGDIILPAEQQSADVIVWLRKLQHLLTTLYSQKAHR
jgi:hypothetical protein